MHHVLIDSTKFIDSITNIINGLNIYKESRNKLRNDIISTLINNEVKLSVLPPVEEVLNDHLCGFKQPLNDSTIALEKTRFENAIKVALFSSLTSQAPSIRTVITNYKYGVGELIKEGVLS